MNLNLCRCTGYIRIVEAIERAAAVLAGGKPATADANQGIGGRQDKYEAWETAVGRRPFVADLRIPGMVFGALKFSDHARARVRGIDTQKAARMPGVLRVFTAADIPGERLTGLIVADWPLMIAAGETCRSGADVLAGVVATSEAQARAAAKAIRVDYEVLEPLTDMLQAEQSPILVHEKGNLLETCVIRRGGDVDGILAGSAFTASGTFRTQMIEHAFLETEAAVALPEEGGVRLYSQGQGVYEDRRQVASLLGLARGKGTGYPGGQRRRLRRQGGHHRPGPRRPVRPAAAETGARAPGPARVDAHAPQAPSLGDGIRPGLRPGRQADGAAGQDHRRHRRLRLGGDQGAGARRRATPAGAYHVPAADIEARTVYTNNLPCGAMRGFGVNQVTFAMESCIDMLCEQGGFDRWQFRYDNALDAGRMTASGQVLGAGVGVRACLLALKDEFYKSPTAGLACGIKNTGIGNGMTDDSEVKIEVVSGSKLVIHHGWTEMGQGVHTVARQVVCQETGLDPGSWRCGSIPPPGRAAA